MFEVRDHTTIKLRYQDKIAVYESQLPPSDNYRNFILAFILAYAQLSSGLFWIGNLYQMIPVKCRGSKTLQETSHQKTYSRESDDEPTRSNPNDLYHCFSLSQVFSQVFLAFLFYFTSFPDSFFQGEL